MKKFNFGKIVFINVLIALIFMFSGVCKYEVFAAEGCTAGQVVDYLAELTNLGMLEDNSFEGKKQGLNKFGIEGLEYLTSPEDKVTIEKLSSVCVAIMNYLGEDKGIKAKADYSDYQFKSKNGEILYSDGEWDPSSHLVVDTKLKNELNERVIVKKLGRINDLNDADKRYRLDLVTVLKKGIIIGKSLGKYSQKRNIEPKRQVSLKEVKKAIDRTYNMDKRYPMSPDGQLIRKTNLPVNASEYKYILAAYPNSFYETRFSYENFPTSIVKLHETYDPPKFTYDRLKDGYISYNNIYEEADKIRRFQDYRFNIDYRIIDGKWIDKMVSFYRKPQDGKKELKGIKNELKKYVKFVKDNKIIIEAKPSSTEASAIYYDGFDPYFHEHMKFRIVSCKNLDKNLKKIIYGVLFVNEPWGIIRSYKEKVKLGKWMEGVYSINYPMRSNYPNNADYYPWKWAGIIDFDNTKRNLRKKKLLKLFKITPNDKDWYYPGTIGTFYGWK